MKSITERDLLHELFPGTARELFGDGGVKRATLGIYDVADGRRAFVRADRLVELDPVDPAGKNVLHCDLCHVTRSRSEAAVYRAEVAPRRYRYITLCLSTQHCQQRAGHSGLNQLADRLMGDN